MDLSSPPIKFIDLDPPSPEIKPCITLSEASYEKRFPYQPSLQQNPNPNPNPNPYPNPILNPENAVPIRRLSPDLSDRRRISGGSADVVPITPTTMVRVSSDDLARDSILRTRTTFESLAEASEKRSESHSTLLQYPNPNSNPILSPENAVPLRRLSPDSAAGTSTAIAAPLTKKKKKKTSSRSAEMVRASSYDLVLCRDSVRRTRITFESLRSLLIRNGEKALRASIIMLERNLWLYRGERIIGSIPGVHVGDIFFSRMELCLLGLHGQNQAGIDYVGASKSSSGEPIATSIVVSGGYEDDEDNGDELVYTGHGGRERNLEKHILDQKLEGGNLALERSMVYGIEIRVIRGLDSNRSPTGRVYVYDGLYRVLECWSEVGKSKFCVYKYKLVRLGKQEDMGSAVIKMAADLKKDPLGVRPDRYLSVDLSVGEEKLPVFVFNDIDGDQEPLQFGYVVRPIYTHDSSLERMNNKRGGAGCSCVSSCLLDCYCAMRNGGELLYDGNGILLKGKPLIYECGALCRCPPSCSNRVSQKGLRNRLEIFRSKETGWGVRSLDLIPAGSFICEFSGIVLAEQETQVLCESGASLVYPNRFPPRWREWGDISDVFPEYAAPEFPSFPQLSFSIDVSKKRNVACYLSHSCSPNVFLQFVLYDHYDVSFPHLMVFATENIPPMRELSIDYGVGTTNELRS